VGIKESIGIKIDLPDVLNVYAVAELIESVAVYINPSSFDKYIKDTVGIGERVSCGIPIGISTFDLIGQ